MAKNLTATKILLLTHLKYLNNFDNFANLKFRTKKSLNQIKFLKNNFLKITHSPGNSPPTQSSSPEAQEELLMLAKRVKKGKRSIILRDLQIDAKRRKGSLKRSLKGVKARNRLEEGEKRGKVEIIAVEKARMKKRFLVKVIINCRL